MRLPPYPKYRPSGVEWLGDVPAHWDIGKFSREVRIAEGQADPEVEPYASMILVAPNHIESGTGRLLARETAVDQGAISGKYMCRAGEVIYSKIRPALAKATLAPEDCLCSADMYPMTPTGRLHSRYLLLLFLSSQFTSWSVLEADRVAMPKVNREALGDLRLPIPPAVEQSAIAVFIDRHTSKIDTLVARKRTLIERLKEKRTTLISRTVTAGLPPDAARAAGLDLDVTRRPSGIDWLGDVPARWKVLPFTKYITEKSDYRGQTPDKTQDGVFLITAKNVRMGYIDYEASQEYVAAEEYDEIMRRGLPKKGDILFTTEAPLGNVALVDREDVALAQRIIRFRLKPEYFRETFALYGMMSSHFQLQLQSLSTGSTAEGLKASKLPMLRLVAPPTQEQEVIGAFLATETGKIDAMVAKVDQAIERLHEYRTALITAAVMGKIDVRTVT